MNLLIKNARVICESSSFHGENVDIFIENGIIKSIGKDLKNSADQEISRPGLCISLGWMDIFSHKHQ